MKAMQLQALCRLEENREPLRLVDLPRPEPGRGELLLELAACGVCHTELDEIEGRTPPPRLPVIPGHQAVGRVAGAGPGADRSRIGETVGVAWAGDTTERAPEELQAVIDTTPAWRPVVEALASLAPGGRLVINAIRKEDADKEELARLDYPAHLWMEKEIKSVANVARRDVTEFLQLAAAIPMRPELQIYPLEEANRALVELKQRHIHGAKVLVTGSP